MWDKEIKFVNDLFIKNNNCLKDFKQAFRRRDEHTSRILKLAMNIVNSLDKDKKMFLDIDAISLTCIFHDVGIDNVDFRQSHGYRSSQIFESYAKENNFDPKLIEKVSSMILVHEDKSLLKSNISEELKIVIEANWLDEEGVLGITRDLLTIGENAESYKDVVRYIEENSLNRIDIPNPMDHEYARVEWEKKRKFVKSYLKEYKKELYL